MTNNQDLYEKSKYALIINTPNFEFPQQQCYSNTPFMSINKGDIIDLRHTWKDAHAPKYLMEVTKVTHSFEGHCTSLVTFPQKRGQVVKRHELNFQNQWE